MILKSAYTGLHSRAAFVKYIDQAHKSPLATNPREQLGDHCTPFSRTSMWAFTRTYQLIRGLQETGDLSFDSFWLGKVLLRTEPFDGLAEGEGLVHKNSRKKLGEMHKRVQRS